MEQLAEIFPDGRADAGPQRPDRDEPYFERFSVPNGTLPLLETAEAPLITWGGVIELLDMSLPEQTVAPGETAVLTLTYAALADIDSSYTAYVHLLDGSGGPPVAQVDSEPCGGALPTAVWRAGDIIRDRIALAIPAELAPGAYEVALGFYTWPDLTPLPADSAPHSPLATLTIE